MRIITGFVSAVDPQWIDPDFVQVEETTMKIADQTMAALKLTMKAMDGTKLHVYMNVPTVAEKYHLVKEASQALKMAEWAYQTDRCDSNIRAYRRDQRAYDQAISAWTNELRKEYFVKVCESYAGYLFYTVEPCKEGCQPARSSFSILTGGELYDKLAVLKSESKRRFNEGKEALGVAFVSWVNNLVVVFTKKAETKPAAAPVPAIAETSAQPEGVTPLAVGPEAEAKAEQVDLTTLGLTDDQMAMATGTNGIAS